MLILRIPIALDIRHLASHGDYNVFSADFYYDLYIKHPQVFKYLVWFYNYTLREKIILKKQVLLKKHINGMQV